MMVCRILFITVCTVFLLYGCDKEPSYKKVYVQCSAPFQASLTKVFSCNYGSDVSMEDAFKNMLSKRFQGEISYYKSVGLQEADMPVQQILANPLPEKNTSVSYGTDRYSAMVSNDNDTIIEYIIDVPDVFVLNLQVKADNKGKAATARYTFKGKEK